MLSIAVALFILSLSIYLLGLEGVFSSKRFPDDTDTPCMLAFLVLGIIFLNLGVVYRDMAVHPELFEKEETRKDEWEKMREEWKMIKKRLDMDKEDVLELLDDGEPKKDK